MAKRGRKPDPMVMERDMRIIAAAKRGVHPHDIAKREAGCTLTTVQRVLREARDEGISIPTFPRLSVSGSAGIESLVINISQEQFRKLRDYAGSRGLLPTDCIGLLLSTIIDDDLFEAVLDDGGPPPGAA